MDILSASGIHKSYANHKALEDITLNIPKQSIFGLLGPNGAGKSTFIRIINQIINADQGEIRINGELLNPSHISMIGYLPEERGLYKKMKVGDHLMYLAQLKGLSATEAKKRIKSWMQRFEALTWWEKKVEDLSKGMQQKIQFIATVVHEPELIILDEPFSGFDPINANLIKNEILDLREKGATIIFSTHRMESVEELCDHIALIHKSHKILDGEKSDIKNSYRDKTYNVRFVGELPEMDPAAYNLKQQDNGRDGLHAATIRIMDDRSPNQLLQDLMQKVEIHGFEEKIPSINEIFINQVEDKAS